MRATQNVHSTTEVVEHTTLQPGQHTTVLLGIYEDLIPQPDFMVESSCNKIKDAYLQAELVRVNNRGDYSLAYHLRNNSDASMEVTIRERCVARV